jgi:hypothetical protein
MKLKINTDGKQYFIIKDDEGVKVTETLTDRVNFSKEEANKIMFTLKQWGVLILKNIDYDDEYVSFDYENIILE